MHPFKPPNVAFDSQVREYSFLSNLRVPATVLASQTATVLNNNGNGELQRLTSDFAGVKILTISNLAALATSGTDLYAMQVLSAQTARQLEHSGFHSITGNWCCAALGDAPQHASFRLPLLPAGQ